MFTHVSMYLYQRYNITDCFAIPSSPKYIHPSHTCNKRNKTGLWLFEFENFIRELAEYRSGFRGCSKDPLGNSVPSVYVLEGYGGIVLGYMTQNGTYLNKAGWPNGKALDYESRDCRFDPCVGQFFGLFASAIVFV